MLGDRDLMLSMVVFWHVGCCFYNCCVFCNVSLSVALCKFFLLPMDVGLAEML